jgi:signal peptidase I
MLVLVELIKCFGRYKLHEQGLAALVPFIYLPFLALRTNYTFLPVENRSHKKTAIREWTDAIIFAIIAASIIRIFLFEAYSIPTSSMEKSLLVGDFLFVSKIAYGPRSPMTPLAFPFVHHTMPLSQTTKSYFEWPKLKYFRFPGLSKIKRNDAFVFNFPDGDTLSLKFQSEISYHSLVRRYGRERVLNDSHTFGEIISRPLDKRENFIKRCVGMPGDKLEIKDQQIYIDDKPIKQKGIQQFKYRVTTNGNIISNRIKEKLNITEKIYSSGQNQFIITLTNEGASKLKNASNVKSVSKIIDPKGQWDSSVFPFVSTYKWNIDNFGPIIIPKEGESIDINISNLCLYKRIITAFEGNKLNIKNGNIYINDKVATKYTFKQNYYWAMGDNRHNSADSRLWGFVPEDHVVGKASFVWFSLDKNKSLFNGKIRWSKLFRVVK